MTKKLDEPVVTRHIAIYAADWEFLSKNFGHESEERLGVSTAIRGMIRKGVRDYQERVARRKERAAQSAHGAVSAVSFDEFFNKGDMG